MSVYSGFATRKQELSYAQLSESLVMALVRRLTKFYQGASCNQTIFCDSLRKIYVGMSKLEQYKHLSPKYSPSLKPLIEQLKIDTTSMNKTIDMSVKSPSPPKNLYDLQKTEQTHKRRIFSSKKSERSFDSSSVRRNTATLCQLLESQKIQARLEASRQALPSAAVSPSKQELRSAKKSSQQPIAPDRESIIPSNSSESKILRQFSRTYDKIINNVINTKQFKRRRYELKKDQSTRFHNAT